MTEPMPVHPAAVLTARNSRPCDDAVIPALREITAAVKRHDTVVLQQLYQVGERGDHDNSFHPNWSPSGMPSLHDPDGTHAMSEAQIEETIRCSRRPRPRPCAGDCGASA